MSEPSKPKAPKAKAPKAPGPPDQEPGDAAPEPPQEGSPSGGDEAANLTTQPAEIGDTERHAHEWKRIVDLEGRTNAATFHTHRCRCGATVRIG